MGINLPIEYNAAATESELNRVSTRVTQLYTAIPLIPLSTAPVSPSKGWIAMSDGTGSGFDTSSGEGLYRYSGSAWVFIG